MKAFFFTSNHHKFAEISDVLSKYGIILSQKNIDFDERGETPEEVVLNKAKDAYRLVKKPVVTEDTAVYFDAYRDFPGLYAKRTFRSLGFSGLLKLLDGKTRKAHFKTSICSGDKGKYKVFSGVWKGKISRKIYSTKEVMAYERIFVPDGYRIPLCHFPRELKNRVSHRGRAAAKLGRWVKERPTIK
ncbi:MAG: hypothetical protein HZB68_02570 [Candidatus Aenigmarchaeota archaeon]|nr:hypothetical protein [Candidatus Aenigmarchaeota archaeon]